jgi:hypothetical protein
MRQSDDEFDASKLNMEDALYAAMRSVVSVLTKDGGVGEKAYIPTLQEIGRVILQMPDAFDGQLTKLGGLLAAMDYDTINLLHNCHLLLVILPPGGPEQLEGEFNE